MLTHLFFDEGQTCRLTWIEKVPNARPGEGGGWGCKVVRLAREKQSLVSVIIYLHYGGAFHLCISVPYVSLTEHP